MQRHVGDLFPVVLANDRIIPSRGEMAYLEPVALPAEPPAHYILLTADVIDERQPWRHDSTKLAQALMSIYQEPPL
jgi:hypothetical protein